MKKSIFQETDVDLQNVILQTMALTFKKYKSSEMEAIYKVHNIKDRDLNKDISTFIKKGWMTGVISRIYYSYEEMGLNADYWSAIARGIDPGKVDLLLSREKKAMEDNRSQYYYYRRDSKDYTNFTKAYIAYAHDMPFDKILDEDSMPKPDSDRLPWEVATGMVRHPEDRAFLKNTGSNTLYNIYVKEFYNKWYDMELTVGEDVFKELYLDNKKISQNGRNHYRDIYLMYYLLPTAGRIKELAKQATKDSNIQKRLTHLLMVHNGQYQEAYEGMTKILKEAGDDIFYFPIMDFAYAIAIGLCGDPKARKMGEKLLKRRNIKGNPWCYALELALHHYILGDTEEFLKGSPFEQCPVTMNRLLAIYFVKHNHIPIRSAFSTSKDETFLNKSNYDYFRLLFSEDFALFKPLADELKRKTGLGGGPLPYVKIMQPWEKVLDQVTKMNSVGTKNEKKSESQERVIYMVNMKNYDIAPRLQKSKDGGATWSSGRNIAASSFNASKLPCMSEQDLRISAAMNLGKYSYFPFSGRRIMAELVGCPYVYSEDGEMHIDVVEEPLQLTVQPSPSGYKVTTNADINKLRNNIVVESVGNRQITVIHVSENQCKTIELLSTIKSFPLESKEMLGTALQEISQSFTVMSPLLKNSAQIRQVDSNPLIAVQITPIDNQMFQVALAVKPFGSHPPYQRPGQGMPTVSTTIEGEKVQTERNLDAERENLEVVRTMMTPFDDQLSDDDRWSLDTASCLQLLEQMRTTEGHCYIEWPQGVKLRVVKPMITSGMMSLKISSAGQWFEIEGDVTISENEKLKMAQLLEMLRSSTGNFIRLSDDEYIALSEQLRRQLQAIDKMLVGKGKGLKLATMNGMQLSALEDMGVKVKADKSFRELVKRIREADKQEYPIPNNIHAQLRPYQVTGYQWMSRLAYWGGGACLADDMGLGKTLQAITLMLSRASQGPQLVVVPTSLLQNWKSELLRFAPALTPKILNQAGIDRSQTVETAEAGDIVIATYGLLVTEGELLAQRTWTTIVLDEAHSIKNRDTQTSKSAMTLKADFRLMLTGTPLQNHLNEIWNLFQFANPGLLGSYNQFTERFIIPIERDHDRERQRLLRRLLSPFLLRRTKDDVLNELPEKTEITLRVELSPEEQALYDNLRQQAILNLEDNSKGAIQALAEITKLRQAACHPRLVNPKLKLASSKTQAFLSLAEQLINSGHRALVFSQFTSHLALIREELDKQQTPYLYLDGSTSANERARLVKAFQTGSQPLFLISLKAGGLGLNLTAADYVIHLDPWWNPAIEDQASDRTHRIGQERPVTVYRLIAAGTIEEKILRLHHNKRSMADALLEDADLFTQISADEIVRLLKQSAEQI